MICQKREPRPSAGRGLGNPQMWANYVTRAPLRKTHGRARSSFYSTSSAFRAASCAC
jgi:hypothetical protein